MTLHLYLADTGKSWVGADGVSIRGNTYPIPTGRAFNAEENHADQTILSDLWQR